MVGNSLVRLAQAKIFKTMLYNSLMYTLHHPITKSRQVYKQIIHRFWLFVPTTPTRVKTLAISYPHYCSTPPDVLFSFLASSGGPSAGKPEYHHTVMSHQCSAQNNPNGYPSIRIEAKFLHGFCSTVSPISLLFRLLLTQSPLARHIAGG